MFLDSKSVCACIHYASAVVQRPDVGTPDAGGDKPPDMGAGSEVGSEPRSSRGAIAFLTAEPTLLYLH